MPSPLPEIIGTRTPKLAKRGAMSNEALSPTPPVECLSTTEVEEAHSIVLPLSSIALVR